MMSLRNAEKSGCNNEFEMKRRKIQTNEELLQCPKNIELMDLIDDCIESICARLPLEDLCSFSLTCKRVYQIANRHFSREYKSHHVEIVNTLAGPRIGTKEPYAKCFISNIRNLRITSHYSNLSLTPLLSFIRINFCENLRALELNSVKIGRNQPNGNCIVRQLENLEAISFIDCLQYDIYEGFLRHCKRLKHLVVKEVIDNVVDCSWMSQEYPSLETLAFSRSSNLKLYTRDPLHTFFQLNPRLKRVKCSDFQILSCILILDIALDCLVFCFEELARVEDCIHILNVLCSQNRVHRLRIEFGHRCNQNFVEKLIYDGLVGLGSVLDGLSCKSLKYCSIITKFDYRFENVKFLSIKTDPINATIMSIIAYNLPNLNEIHLDFLWNTAGDDPMDCICVAVKELKNLRIMVVYQIVATDTGSEYLDFSRIMLLKDKDPCPLTMYLPYDVAQKAKFKNPSDSMVAVEPISSLKHEIPFCDITLL